jgi:hypothetical protein
VQKGNDTAQLTQQGAHATVSYTLWGTEGYDGATPEHPFDPSQGYYGALQLAFRYGWLGIDDATFPIYASPTASVTSAQSAHRRRRLGSAAQRSPCRQLRADGLQGRRGDLHDASRPGDRIRRHHARAGEFLS